MEHQDETLEGAVSVLEHGQALEVLDSATTEQAAEILRQGTAENTLRAREADARYFWTWADVARGLEEHYPVSGDLMVLFITQHLAEDGLPEEIEAEMVRRRAKRQGRLAVATVQRRVSTLSSQHRVLGLEDVNPARDPRVVELLKAARKIRARNGGQSQVDPATLPVLERMLTTCQDDLCGIRDRALLLVGFAAGGRRRAELAALKVEDLELLEEDGERAYIATIRRSKTDQEGKGHAVAIVGRAALALEQWLSVSGINAGPIFRGIFKGQRTIRENGISGKAIEKIIKGRAKDADLKGRITPHSLRAGFTTDAFRRGHSLPDIMSATGHKSVPAVMRYGRGATALKNPTARISDG